MLLHNNRYIVSSYVETAPPLDQFDIVHNTEKIDIHDAYMARIMKIDRSDGHSFTVALLDQICSGNTACAILEKGYLTLILFQAILRIDLDTGSILQYVRCKNLGGLFEIHRIHGGYLIWGEGDIFRYDDSLNQIWHFTGRDILVSPHTNKNFWIKDHQIHCCDFSGWQYILDFDGNVLQDFHAFPTADTL